VQVFLDRSVRDRVHAKPRHGYVGSRIVVRPSPQTEAAEDAVLPAPQESKHSAGVALVEGLAENPTIAIGDRVAANDDAAVDPGCHVGGLLAGQSRHDCPGGLVVARAAFSRFAWRYHLELVTCLREQLTPAW
jgi:hypothetical protein